MLNTNLNDILIYSDSGQIFVGSVSPLVKQMKDGGHDLLFFEATPIPNENRTLLTDTKRYVLDHYLIAPNSSLADTKMVCGNFMFIRNSKRATDFMIKWRNDMIECLLMVDDRFNQPLREFPKLRRSKNDMGPLTALIAIDGSLTVLPYSDKEKVLKRYTKPDRNK
jgi:hypothetical protein